MSNSPLVSYTQISPNKTVNRNHVIDRITPHCVVGQLSVESIGSIFVPESRQASSNYGIGVDGRVGMYCEEKDRSWCTSSRDNDHRAITIECASDKTHPYAFKDNVYEKLIELCADICKRNGKSKLLWLEDKDKTLNYEPASDEMVLTVHRWFANKSCPGEWLYSRLSDLATKVTAILNPINETENEVMYKVQVGKAVSTFEEAKALGEKVKKAGFDCYIVTEGYTPVEVAVEPTPTPAPAPVPTPEPAVIKVGSKVKIKDGAKSYDGKTMHSFVFGRVYTVDDLKGDRAVLDKKGICSPFHVKDLILQD